MIAIMEGLEVLLEHAVELAVLLFKYIGVITIIGAGIKAVLNALKKDVHTRLVLGEGLALGLGFLLVGEVLETAITVSVDQVIVVACIFVLRAAMSILLHWERKNERAELSEHHHC